MRQAYEEALHSQSYDVMVQAISDNTDEIYEMWRKDVELRNKNDYIADVYMDLAKNPTETKLPPKHFLQIKFWRAFIFILAFHFSTLWQRVAKC